MPGKGRDGGGGRSLGLREGLLGRSGYYFRGCWIGSYHAGGSLGCCVAAFVARDE